MGIIPVYDGHHYFALESKVVLPIEFKDTIRLMHYTLVAI
jgi:hypothetical protein